ncbi:MAG: cupin domain-containing protein [Thermomicrobiales bacterium]|nr:cupin domain-containing protein [Thermomicrobiales bacterium]
MSGYAPSPRPTFDGPAPIPYASVARHLWGDPEAGEVADWIYVSSDRIHQLVWGVPVGGGFRHSDAFRTIFAADVLYLVLQGTMVIANPATGEVHRIAPGEAAFFRRDTWHHAWNDDITPLRVLEFFAPPPSQGTSGSYARMQPPLEAVHYTRVDLLGRWPMERAAAAIGQTIWSVREHDLLWTMLGAEHPTPVGLLAATDRLTVGRVRLLPGRHMGAHSHDGDESLYVRSGVLNVRLARGERPNWFELHPGDGFYLPRGTIHAYHNIGAEPAEFYFGVAPRYQPPEDA